ncbi:hypothetical protein [Marinilabilia salmonicolor]|uniref:Uncharacterized protein n=1 Tax=Marinilabilia salmonicolor TaxID=989 RepID=A0A368UIU9_9BACT|nr:hypothetical protein [Marinilabilia salmonicolor]RCW21182.1 hypothetical protein DFO77_1565 [Marinilabilia salmonicolor]
MANINNALLKSTKIISPRLGILHSILKLPRQVYDPLSINFGVFPCDSTKLFGEKYEGRSSGCNFEIYDSFMGTIGETIERYCPAFYDTKKMVKSNVSHRPPTYKSKYFPRPEVSPVGEIGIF